MAGKVFNDPVHGSIEIPELCVKIIDTRQFQRLRYIKQLGGVYFVFPGASHNRFEHSIGVCYLAGELTRRLQLCQPELGITDRDVLCVQIAGLCHDLGHGPFSHLFEKCFMTRYHKDPHWRHEKASVQMFDYMLTDSENNLQEELGKNNLDETDLKFISELIDTSASMEDNAEESWPYEGRQKDKGFLYKIVNNQRTGVDVDKWDYFARDCHHLGLKNTFDHRRLIKFARVIQLKDKPGHMEICVRDKEVFNLYDMFYTRMLLHRRAYQHKTTVSIELMITDALHLANDHLRIPVEPALIAQATFSSADGGITQGCRLSDAVNNIAAFATLDDSIYLMLLHSTRDELKPARDLIRRIERRQHYRVIGETKPRTDSTPQDGQRTLNDVPVNLWQSTVMAEIVEVSRIYGPGLTSEALVVLVTNFNYGQKTRNPVDEFYFYRKTQPDRAFHLSKDEVSKMLPDQFGEDIIRIYCKDDSLKDTATKCVKKVCELMHLQSVDDNAY